MCFLYQPMSVLRLRCRDPKREQTIGDLTSSSSIATLISRLSRLTDIPFQKLAVLRGYPPKPIIVTSAEASLESLGIKNNDTLIAREDPSAACLKEVPAPAETHTAVEVKAASAGHSRWKQLVLKEIPSDNSCLFNAVAFTLEKTMELAPILRQTVASIIESDPSAYNDALLGKPPPQYVDWILKPSSWGGGVELQILSDYYQCEMAAIDVQTLNVYIYGSEKHFSKRIYLIYNGIHYDTVVGVTQDDKQQSVFDPQDQDAFSMARSIAETAHTAHQFVDTGTFTLRCNECGASIKGQEQALAHAKDTRHTSFSEFR